MWQILVLGRISWPCFTGKGAGKAWDLQGRCDERHEGIDVCYQSKIVTAPSLAGFAFAAR